MYCKMEMSPNKKLITKICEYFQKSLSLSEEGASIQEIYDFEL